MERRFLVWFNRDSCGCGCYKPLCWRHRLLHFLSDLGVLIAPEGDFFHNGHFRRWGETAPRDRWIRA